MACNCINCPNLVTVTDVAVASGVTTLTVPATVSFTSGKTYCLGLFIDMPNTTGGTQISVTNGTSTWIIYNKIANYYRPCCALKSRALIKVKYYDDPAHLLKV